MPPGFHRGLFAFFAWSMIALMVYAAGRTARADRGKPACRYCPGRIDPVRYRRGRCGREQ